MALLVSRALKDHEDDTSWITLAGSHKLETHADAENVAVDGTADAPFRTAAAHTATSPGRHSEHEERVM